jgi:hypothetical protein
MSTPANALNITAAGIVKFDGTATFSADTVTQHDVLIGGASNAITSVAPSATSGVAMISQGAAADPTFGTVVVAGGGTGAVTLTGVLIGSGTSAVTGNAITQHDVLVGGAANAITSVAPSATSGVPLVSGGAAADPSFTTAVVAGGGTGVVSFADTNSLLISGTTSTGALQDVASVATGQVLTSAGTSTAPAWSSAPSVTSITLSSGTALSAYAEGTWTPTLVGHTVAGTTSYTVQTALYTRIGRLVFCTMSLSCTTGGTASGLFQFGGLPFTINNTASGVIGLVTNSNTNIPFDAGQTMYTLYPQGGGTTFYLQESGSSKASNLMSIAAATAYVFNASFWFSI